MIKRKKTLKEKIKRSKANQTNRSGIENFDCHYLAFTILFANKRAFIAELSGLLYIVLAVSNHVQK